jgi:murein L,D-transpeptidase YafK
MRLTTPIRLLAPALLLLPLALYALNPPEGGEATVAKPGLQDIGLEGERSRDALYSQALSRLEERLRRYPADYEASLLKGLIQFKSGDVEHALAEIQGLLEREPKFHLAHLIQGDLLLSQSQVISDIGAAPLLSKLRPQQADLALLREEAEARLRAYLDSLPQGRLPRALLMMDEGTPTALLVDKRSHRLYVYERGDNGVPRLLRDFYVSTGKLKGNKRISGDLRTPEGVYFITRHIPGEKLPDLYGIGAYPMNYPNEWDRHLGKTGYGIWLHGTENAFYSRPPRDSEGCVVLPNLDLAAVGPYLQPGVTPIVVTDRVQWLERPAWQVLRNEVAAALEQWRQHWAGATVEDYLDHYSPAFWSRGHDADSWARRKKLVASGKRWQRIELSALSLFTYPRAASNGREMVVANFHQQYDSNNFESEMDKRLYLVKEEGAWRILYEGTQ